MGPECVQVGPKCVQDSSKSVQVGLKLTPRASKLAPRALKLAPSWSPKPPSGPQVRPSWRPRGLQEASKRAWSAKQPEPRNLTTVQRFSWFFQGSAGAWSHLAGLLDGSLAAQRPSWTAKCVQEPPKEHRTARQTGPERPKSTGRRARRRAQASQSGLKGEKNPLDPLRAPEIRSPRQEH